MIARSNVDRLQFGNITTEKICNQMTFLFYNIKFVYGYYRIEKQKKILYAFSAATLSCRRASFLAAVFKSLFSSCTSAFPTLIRKLLNKIFFAP